MTAILIRNTAGSVTAFLQNEDGTPATGLTFEDVVADYRAGTGAFTNKSLLTPASAQIGSGVNGTINLAVQDVASVGNTYDVEVLVPAGTSGLSVSWSSPTLTVNLAVSGGVPVALSNTAALVAAAINALSSVDITATATGDGSGSLSIAQTDNFDDGIDYLVEIGDGFYDIDFTSSQLDFVGNLTVRVTGSTIRTAVVREYVRAAAPTAEDSDVASAPPTTTTIFGWVYDGTGAPVEDAGVSVRIVGVPHVYSSSTYQGGVITSDVYTTLTDASGFFELTAIVGAVVEVFIPSSNYRRTVVVPATSANIFDME